MATTDPFGGLSGSDRDAYAAMLGVLQQYGLESLASTVLDYIKQGYSEDTISILLPETDAYKKRFAANTARQKAGLPVLSPAEYLAVEDSYRQILSSAGLPPGFYDQPSDFTKWIEQDVAPTEIQQRVQVASDMVNNLDPSAKAQFSQWYTTGDMVAYALDRQRASTVLERQWRAAQVGGAAQDQGLSLTREQGERIADLGLSDQQARAGLGQVAQINQSVGRLSSIYGGDYDEQDALNEVFFDDQGSAQQRRRLASQERAQFGGSSATSTASLSTRRGGQI